jgi:integrase
MLLSKQNYFTKGEIKERAMNDIQNQSSFSYWISQFLELTVRGVRSEEVTKKIQLHVERFRTFFIDSYVHEQMEWCLKRDVLAWQRELLQNGLAHSTVNNHLASLSAFTTWVHSRAPHVFPSGDPVKGISELALPPLEPRALTDEQIRSLKNICDRLERFHQLKGRRVPKDGAPRLRSNARPLRDRAIVFVLLSTGLRREELILLNIDQVVPNIPDELCLVKKALITKVKGKGKTERTVFLSNDARLALADYLERERPKDSTEYTKSLFLRVKKPTQATDEGRLSPRSINLILEQIGQWHDAEMRDDSRKLSPLRPHDLRHTFAFQLAKTTGADAYELERRLGHRSERYIQRYTNPPEEVAAGYVEDF